MWPALIAILFLTPDRLSHDVFSGRGQKSDKFLDDIRRQISTQARLRELGLVCALDICRAAMYIDPRGNEEVPLRLLAYDIIHEIKVANSALLKALAYIFIERLVSQYRD